LKLKATDRGRLECQPCLDEQLPPFKESARQLTFGFGITVLVLWAVAGLAIALRRFSWTPATAAS